MVDGISKLRSLAAIAARAPEKGTREANAKPF